MLELDNTVADSFSVEVEPGTLLNDAYIAGLVEARGHLPYGGIDGPGDSLYAESGQTYEMVAYL